MLFSLARFFSGVAAYADDSSGIALDIRTPTGEMASVETYVVENKEGLRAVAATLGGRAQLWMGQSIPQACPRLRTTSGNTGRLALCRLHDFDARKCCIHPSKFITRSNGFDRGRRRCAIRLRFGRPIKTTCASWAPS